MKQSVTFRTPLARRSSQSDMAMPDGQSSRLNASPGGAPDAPRVPVVHVPLSVWIAYRVGLRKEDEIIREALIEARRDHARASGLELESAVANRTIVDSRTLNTMVAYVQASDRLRRHEEAMGGGDLPDDATGDGAAQAQHSHMGTIKFPDLVIGLDPKAVTLGPRARIGLSNLLVIVVSCVALLLTMLLLQREFALRREVAQLEGMRATVASFGDGFDERFVDSALFELEDEASTLVQWLDYRYSHSVRSAAQGCELLARRAAGSLRDVLHGHGSVENATAFAASDMIRAVGELEEATARTAAPAPSVTAVAAALGELVTSSNGTIHAAMVDLDLHVISGVAAEHDSVFNNAAHVVRWFGALPGQLVTNPSSPRYITRLSLPEFAFRNGSAPTADEQPLAAVLHSIVQAAIASTAGSPAAITGEASVRSNLAETVTQVASPSACANALNAAYGVERSENETPGHRGTSAPYRHAWWRVLPRSGFAVLLLASAVDEANAHLQAAASMVGSMTRRITSTAKYTEARTGDARAAVNGNGLDDLTEVVLARVRVHHEGDTAPDVTLLSAAERPGGVTETSVGRRGVERWLGAEISPTASAARRSVSTASSVNSSSVPFGDALLNSLRAELESAPQFLSFFRPLQDNVTLTPADGLVHGEEGDGAQFVGSWRFIDVAWHPSGNCSSAAAELTATVVVVVTPLAHLRASFVENIGGLVTDVDKKTHASRDVAAFVLSNDTGAVPLSWIATDSSDRECVSSVEPVAGHPCPSHPQWLAAAGSAFDGQVTRGKLVGTSRRGVPAVVAFARSTRLNVAIVFTDEMSVVNLHALNGLAAGIDRAMRFSPVVHPHDVALWTLGGFPTSRTFDPRTSCQAPAICEPRWLRCDNDTALWCRAGYGSLSTCPGCIASTVATLTPLVRYTQRPTRGAVDLPVSITDDMAAKLRPYTPPQGLGTGPVTAESVVRDGRPRSTTLTVESGSIVVSYTVLPELGAIVAATTDTAVVNQAIASDALVLSLVALGYIILALVLIRFVAVRVVSQLEGEWQRTRETQTREQHKLDHIVRRRIPPAMRERLTALGVVADREDGAVCTVDTFHFTEASASWTARDVVRYLTYFRHLAHAVAREYNLTPHGTYGDVIHIVAVPDLMAGHAASAGGDGHLHVEAESPIRSRSNFPSPQRGVGAAGDVPVKSATGGFANLPVGPGACAVAALQFATTMLELSSKKFIHRPWRVEALGDLFRLTRAERVELAAQLAAKKKADAELQLAQSQRAGQSTVGNPVNALSGSGNAYMAKDRRRVTTGAPGSSAGDTASVRSHPRERARHTASHLAHLSGLAEEDDHLSDSASDSGRSYSSTMSSLLSIGGIKSRRKRRGAEAVAVATHTQGTELNDIAWASFALLPARAGVGVGSVTYSAARLTPLNPQFDAFGEVFAATHRLQATAPSGRVHVSAQVREIVADKVGDIAPVSFTFSQPLRTVMKGGRNVSSFMLNAFQSPVPDRIVEALHVIHSDRTFLSTGHHRHDAMSDSASSHSDTASSRSSNAGGGGHRPSH